MDFLDIGAGNEVDLYSVNVVSLTGRVAPNSVYVRDLPVLWLRLTSTHQEANTGFLLDLHRLDHNGL